MDYCFNRRDFLKLLAAQTALMSWKELSWGTPAHTTAAFQNGTFTTFCKFCSSACGLSLTVEKGRITAVRGLAADPRTQGIICPRAEQLGRFLRHPARVRTPLVRAGKKGEAKFTPVSWDQALGIIKEKWTAIITEQGAQSIAGYLGETVSLESLWLMPRLFNCLGSPNVFSPSLNSDGGFAFAGQATTGALAALAWENVHHSRCIVLWGCNPTASAPALAHHIDQAKRAGAKLLVINPYKIPLAETADLWIPIRPGTDGALALSLAQVIISESLQDSGFIQKWTEGYPAFKELVFRSDYKPERVAGVCRLTSEQIFQAGRLYAGNRPGLIIGGLGLNLHSQGFQSSRAIHCLTALTGNVNQPGTNLYYSFPVPPLKGLPALESYRDGSGSRATKPLVNLTVGYPDTARLWDLITYKGDNQAWGIDIFRQAASEARPPYNTTQVYQDGYLGTAYPLRSLFLLRGDPVSTLPHALQGNVALAQMEFLIAATHFITPSARYADLVLPLAYPPECTELANAVFPNPGKYLMLREGVVPAPEGCLSEQDLLITLGRTMGFMNEFDFSPTQFIAALFASAPAAQSLNYETIQASPLKMISLFSEDMLFPHPREVAFPTPKGKVQFTSSSLEGKGFNPLPEWSPPVEGPERTPDFAKSYPLVLIAGRTVPTADGSQPQAVLHPTDAATYAIKDGDTVQIESKVGSGRYRATIAANGAPGVVWVSADAYLCEPAAAGSKSFPWPFLIDDKLNDPLIGAPRANEMPVRIARM